MEKELENLNDNPLPITYTVKDGKVTGVDMDAMDFLDVIEPPKDAKEEEKKTFEKFKDTELPLSATVSDKADTLEVPKDAVNVTEKDFEAVFGQNTMGSGSGSDF